jgi:3',5'-cyclic AMP phosphodiesterase CpdA
VRATGASDSPKFTFVAYGDTRSHADDHRQVIAAIVRQRPEFVLQSGDLVDHGTNASEWAEFDNITRPLRDAHIAYYPARGNHDVGPYYPQFVREPFDSGNKYYYAFTRHRCRFIILDSMDPAESGAFNPASAQYQWLVKELAQARKSALNTFVMFHEGPFSVGPHGPTPDAQRWLHPLFVKYRPRAVFCGHDHLYYRTTRDGVTYLVIGGGGAPLYEPENKKLAVPGDVYANTHHIIRCDVDGARVTFTVISLDKMAVSRTPMHPGDTPPAVSVVTPGGTHTTLVPANSDGVVIDKFTLGPK